MAVGLTVAIPLQSAQTHALRVGRGQGIAGGTATVPVYLDDASGVAAMEFQINFDNRWVTAAGITTPPGCLGAAFAIDFEVHDGMAIVRLYREDDLVAGTGLLVSLDFKINAGAAPGMSSELTVASWELSDQYGKESAWTASPLHENATLSVVFSSAIDSDGDGLSDYEEQMLDGSAEYNPCKTDTDVHRADTDGDGMSDGYEVRHALNPLADEAGQDADGDSQSNLAEWIAGTDPTNAMEVFRISSCRTDANGVIVFDWPTVFGRWYSVYSATNLGASSWFTNRFRVPGDGTPQRFTNEDVSESRFFRVGVELQP